MRVKTLIGKKLIDAAGDDLGKIDDVEIDWAEKTVVGLVIEGDPAIKQRFMEGKYAKKLFERLGAQAEPDMVIPVSDVKAIGDVVTLFTDIS